MDISMGSDQKDPRYGQDKGQDLHCPGKPLFHKAHQHHDEHRRQVLDHSGRSGIGKLDGDKICILAEHETGDPVDQHLRRVPALFPDPEGRSSFLKNIIQQHG